MKITFSDCSISEAYKIIQALGITTGKTDEGTVTVTSTGDNDDDNGVENTNDTAMAITNEHQIPWDERVHSANKNITDKGRWQRKRGVAEDELKRVEAELAGLIGESGTLTPLEQPVQQPAQTQAPVQQPQQQQAPSGGYSQPVQQPQQQAPVQQPAPAQTDIQPMALQQALITRQMTDTNWNATEFFEFVKGMGFENLGTMLQSGNQQAFRAIIDKYQIQL